MSAPTSRVVIAAPGPADCSEFLDRVAASRSLHRPWVDPPSTAERFGSYLERSRDGRHACYLARRRDDRALVGVVNVNEIVRGAFLSGYLGFYAFVPHAGTGLMREAVGLVLDEAFGPLGLHRVEANVQPGNEPSLRLVRRLGFEREGFSRGYLEVDGAWRDHERWAMREEIWRDG